MKKSINEITCISCPKGCLIQIDLSGSDYQVTNHQCIKGKEYAITEMTNPTRFITTTIAVNGNPSSRLAVRTNIPIPKSKIFEVVTEIKKIEIKPPVYIGQILINEVAGTDADVIASSEALELEHLL